MRETSISRSRRFGVCRGAGAEIRPEGSNKGWAPSVPTANDSNYTSFYLLENGGATSSLKFFSTFLSKTPIFPIFRRRFLSGGSLGGGRAVEKTL